MVVPYIMFIDIENKKYTPIVFYDTLYIDRYVKNQKGVAIPIEGNSHIYKKILYALDLLGYYVKWRLIQYSIKYDESERDALAKLDKNSYELYLRK